MVAEGSPTKVKREKPITLCDVKEKTRACGLCGKMADKFALSFFTGGDDIGILVVCPDCIVSLRIWHDTNCSPLVAELISVLVRSLYFRRPDNKEKQDEGADSA